MEVVDSPCLVVGTDVTLRCQPDGVPRPQVTWFYNVQQISSNSKYLISDYPDFTLTITDVVSSDAGSYTCTAENTLTNGTVSGAVSGMFSKACGEFAVNAYSFTCTHTHTHTHTHTLTKQTFSLLRPRYKNRKTESLSNSNCVIVFSKVIRLCVHRIIK